MIYCNSKAKTCIVGMVYIMWAVILKNIEIIPKHNTEDKHDETILKIAYKMMKIQKYYLLHTPVFCYVNVFIVAY